MKATVKTLLKTFVGIILLLLVLVPARTQNPNTEILEVYDYCDTDNRAFQVGEKITYKLYYNLNFIWVPAGEVVFTISDLGDTYLIAADGKTYASYDWFFKVRDRYETYVDKETLLPSMSVRNVNEGSFSLYDKTVLNQDKRKAYIKRGKTKDNITEEKEVDMEGCMHDILSVIYFVRNLEYNDMSIGTKIPVKIFIDKEQWPLKVNYRGKEKSKKIKGLGKFNTILFSPEVIAGDVFKENTEMSVWVSDDKNKIPLLIESPVSVGSVKAVLKEYDGLRYDMTSVVD